MRKGLLLYFVIFASLGTFLIEPHSALAKEAEQKSPASEDVKKKVEEVKKEDKDTPDKSDKKSECPKGMKAQSRPSSDLCLREARERE
ncbi:MAG: hypothetical protein WCH20_07375 [Nitrospira sp.]|jgi:uncharacterized protein YabN with tetrapyrrole methylase and pyrophosphatase domain